MNCNCVEEVEKKMRERLGDPLAQLNGVFVHNEETATLEFWPSVTILYRKKKKDGTFAPRQEELALGYSYCPFCGRNMRKQENRQP